MLRGTVEGVRKSDTTGNTYPFTGHVRTVLGVPRQYVEQHGCVGQRSDSARVGDYSVEVGCYFSPTDMPSDSRRAAALLRQRCGGSQDVAFSHGMRYLQLGDSIDGALGGYVKMWLYWWAAHQIELLT